MKYLKPIHQDQTTDSSPPTREPYFFTGFDWTDVDGQKWAVSVPHFSHNLADGSRCRVSKSVMRGKLLSTA
jgi:hypothetical protein